MKPKAYPVLEMAIQDGLFGAWRRAFKHAENPPSEEQRRAWEEAAQQTIMDEIALWFDFGDDESS